MWVPRCIVAAISMLVLTSTPAVVEGTCECADVCPAYDADRRLRDKCWIHTPRCDNRLAAEYLPYNMECDGYCVCNMFGCNCDGCEQVAGGCGWTEQTQARMDTDNKENEDNCADFRTFTSLSAEGKRDFLAEKYCVEDEKVVVEDIYELIRAEVLSKLDDDGSVLTCALFNKSYVDVRHLTLCKDKHQDGEL